MSVPHTPKCRTHAFFIHTEFCCLFNFEEFTDLYYILNYTKRDFCIGILFVDMNIEMHSPLHALLQARLYLYISVLSLHSVLLEQ